MDRLKSDLSEWLQSEFAYTNAALEISTSCFSPQLSRISTALKSLRDRKSFDVLFFTHRPEFFDRSELSSLSDGPVNSLTFCDNRASLLKLEKTFDIAIVCTHILDEHIAQCIIRARSLARVLVAWTWDNHHHEFENLCNCSLADIVVPAHNFCADKLKSPSFILGNSVPLGTGQWSRSFAESNLNASLEIERSNALSGGYIMWQESTRSEHLRKLEQGVPGNELMLIEGTDRKNYFQLSPAERFHSWSAYKVSIQAPFSGDLSLRVFDALITGQVPIVPRECHDLDSVIPEAIQKLLPIIRVEDLSVSSVTAATKEAIAEFDRLGKPGVLDRHAFARENHHITSRIHQIVCNTADLSRSLDIGLRVSRIGVGLVQCN